MEPSLAQNFTHSLKKQNGAQTHMENLQSEAQPTKNYVNINIAVIIHKF